MNKRVKQTIHNNGIYIFPNGKYRFNTCFVLAIRDALIVNNIQINNTISEFIRQLAEMITELFEWNKPIDTFTLSTQDEVERFRKYLTENFQKKTNCTLGIISNKYNHPLIFGDSSKKIVWIEEQNCIHYEAVKEWYE